MSCCPGTGQPSYPSPLRLPETTPPLNSIRRDPGRMLTRDVAVPRPRQRPRRRVERVICDPRPACRDRSQHQEQESSRPVTSPLLAGTSATFAAGHRRSQRGCLARPATLGRPQPKDPCYVSPDPGSRPSVLSRVLIRVSHPHSSRLWIRSALCRLTGNSASGAGPSPPGPWPAFKATPLPTSAQELTDDWQGFSSAGPECRSPTLSISRRGSSSAWR